MAAAPPDTANPKRTRARTSLRTAALALAQRAPASEAIGSEANRAARAARRAQNEATRMERLAKAEAEANVILAREGFGPDGRPLDPGIAPRRQRHHPAVAAMLPIPDLDEDDPPDDPPPAPRKGAAKDAFGHESVPEYPAASAEIALENLLGVYGRLRLHSDLAEKVLVILAKRQGAAAFAEPATLELLERAEAETEAIHASLGVWLAALRGCLGAGRLCRDQGRMPPMIRASRAVDPLDVLPAYRAAEE